METKITKRQFFTGLINLATEGSLYYEDAEGNRVNISADELAEFAKLEIEHLDTRAEKAKERAAAKRAQGDDLSDRIAAVLTDEIVSIGDIAAKLNDEDATVAKVSYRLSQLAANGRATKGAISIPGKKARTIVGYSL